MTDTEWKDSTTIDGTVVSRRALARDAWHKISDGKQWISIVRPYDLARYHYAFSTDGKRWHIYRDGGTPAEHKGTFDGTPRTILALLRRFDKDVPAHIDHS